MRIQTTFGVLAMTACLISGCIGASSLSPTSSPAPSASSPVLTSTPAATTRPPSTSAPTVAPLSWVPILSETLTYGAFAIAWNPEYDASVLVVKESGNLVGFVYLDTEAAADWTFDVSDPDGLRHVATDFVEILRADRTTSDPAGTFTPILPTEVAVGSTRGYRYGFAWKDHVGYTERYVAYVAAIPGGFARVSAQAPPEDVGRFAFVDDATLVRFLPVLDQIVADLRWPTD